MIGAERFAEFVAQVHGDGRVPFPWQQRLAEAVLEHGWPDEVDAPTGMGKTSALDIAVIAAAAAAARGEQPARRIFFVVDRRLVVDEAHRHAALLQARLAEACDGILAEVAAALRGLASSDGSPHPLDVTRMRGGVTWDWRWVRHPDRVGIITGTVDQIGSRMLFRGYGVSPHFLSIDAAMTGVDSLVLIDEAHLAEPLLRSVHAAQAVDCPTRSLRPPARVVRLSATPRDEGHPTTRSVFDLAANLADPEARQRLEARKTLHTVQCPPSQLVAVLAECARAAAVDRQLVAVVANTVSTARAVHTRLRESLDEARLLLLTGRSRPLERARLTYEWLGRLTVGRRDSEPAPPARVVVATQTVEVGANFDFDVLVTESAAWDALVQRIGRVNRVGAALAGTVAVVDPAVSGEPVVYGSATTATWEWLTTRVPAVLWSSAKSAALGWSSLTAEEGLDVSPAALRTLTAEIGGRRAEMTLPAQQTPLVVPAHLNCWTRTSPRPVPDVPVHLFLHGFDTSPEPVRVVWRADVTPDALRADDTGQALTDVVLSMPVRADEVLEVPVAAVRSWLAGLPPTSVSDLEGQDDPRSGDAQGRPVLRVSSGEQGVDVRMIDGGRVRPGDTIVVPSAYGGCDRYGWYPASGEAVVDLADLAGRGRAALMRLDPRTLPQLALGVSRDDVVAAAVAEALQQVEQVLRGPDGEPPRTLPPASAADDEITAALGGLRAVLSSVVAGLPDDDPWVRRWPDLDEARAQASGWRLLAEPTLRMVTARGRAGVGGRGESVVDGELTEDDSPEGSSAGGAPKTLSEHSAEVGELAGAVARRLGLRDDVAASVELAARWHDLGKVEPRFQAMLHGGDRFAALASQAAGAPLAKSGMPASDRRARREAARRSGYPRGGRHEELSAVLTQARLATGNGHPAEVDEDLVVHLVASHHGRARPLLPPITDGMRASTVLDPELGEVEVPRATVDWSHPDRFVELNARYGSWGLGLLESIVRLADIACSAGEYAPGGDAP